MLWLKAFHIVMVTAWFAGLFYLPRLFVYHADTQDALGSRRFELMERRLFGIMTVGALGALGFGIAMVAAAPAYLTMHWLHVKLLLVAMLIAYHAACLKLMRDFAKGRNVRSARWFRLFNEIPALLLMGIVVLAVVKPF